MSKKALLNPVPPAGEEDRVAAVFKGAEEMLGFVPAGMQLYALSPTLLELFAGTVGYFRGETALSPILTTMIRYLASDQAGCKFCIGLNETFLTNLGADLEAARAAREDQSRAPVADNERPLLSLALKVISEPGAVTAADVEACRAAGWGDREIFDASLQASNNRAFTNMLVAFKIEDQDAFI